MSNGEHIRVTVDLEVHEAALHWLRWSERDQLAELDKQTDDVQPDLLAYTIVTATRLLLADLGVDIPPELEQETRFEIKTIWEYGSDRFFQPKKHLILARRGQLDEYIISQGPGLFMGAK